MTREEREQIKETKEYLSQLFLLSERITSLQTDLAKAMYPGKAFPGGGGASMPNDLARNVQQKMEAEKKLWKKVHEFETQKEKIMLQIAELDNNKYAVILHKRYVQHKTWQQINGDLSMVWGKKFPWRSMMWDHTQALLDFYKKYFIHCT